MTQPTRRGLLGLLTLGAVGAPIAATTVRAPTSGVWTFDFRGAVHHIGESGPEITRPSKAMIRAIGQRVDRAIAMQRQDRPLRY